MSRVETFRTILVPASVVEECRALAAHFPGGDGMFVVPVFTGDTITHYISTGHIDKAVADALDNPADFAAQVGADVEQVTALRAAMIVSTDKHDVVLAAHGLSLTATEEV